MESLNLQFNNQLRNVQGLLDEALDSGYLADVTLVSDNLENIPAHKFLLAASSPVLRKILECNDSSQSSQILYLKGISSHYVKKLLRFVYHGQVTIKATESENLCAILQELKILSFEKIIEQREEEQKIIENQCFKTDFLKSTNTEGDTEIHNQSEETTSTINEKDDVEKMENKSESISTVAERSENFSRHSAKKKVLSKITKPNRNKKTPCHECGKLVLHMRQHIQFKHDQNAKKYHCNKCPYISRQFSNVEAHRRNMHELDDEQKRQFPCDKCDSVFTLAPSLKKHIRKVHKKEKETCLICGKQFIRGLTAHMFTVHEGRRFTCDFCGHQATQQSSLKMHIEAKHQGIKHTCYQCGKSFSQLGTLNTHIKNTHKITT